MKRDLITVTDLTDDELQNIFQRAQGFERTSAQERLSLRGKLVGKHCLLLFYEPSTRTRLSFEVAAKTFGMDVCVATAESSSVAKGESIEDTAQTCGALGFDLAVMRHPDDGAVAEFAEHFPTPVINGGSGKSAHPTQALLDAYALWKRDLLREGLRIAICGDILHSRVARSNVRLLNRFGITPMLVAPKELMPDGFTLEAGTSDTESLQAETQHNLDDILGEVDAIMMLRTQTERHGGVVLIRPKDFIAGYQLNAQRLEKLRADAVIMHPGPVVRGSEMTDDVMQDKRTIIVEQVAGGVFVRMALVDLLVQQT
ncbi:aspartate carbamoyltransferase catalytic subunit [bacterium]|nr:aspartate carbamoyltransferase catalytic subunit [bacterium]